MHKKFSIITKSVYKQMCFTMKLKKPQYLKYRFLLHSIQLDVIENVGYRTLPYCLSRANK